MKKTNLIFYILGIVFTVIGFLLMGIGCGIHIGSKQFFDNAIATQATITDISSHKDSDGERSYSAFVDYQTEEKEVTDKKINYYSSNMSIGDTITVYYKASNPEKIRLKQGSFVATCILCSLGAVFTFIGILFLIVPGKRHKKRQNLLRNGRVIFADVTGVNINYGIRINGQSPYFIECSYRDEYSGTTYLFKSDNLWFDPTPMVMGTQLQIYVNQKDLSKYYVDTRGLEKKVVDYR